MVHSNTHGDIVNVGLEQNTVKTVIVEIHHLMYSTVYQL